MIHELWLTLRIQELHTVDKLQVRTIDRDQLTARGSLAGLFREARHVRMAYSQRQARLSLTVSSAHDDLTAVGSHTGRSVHTDHVVTDNLEIGRLHATGELYLRHVGKTRAVDGHRLVGNHLRREEHLDAQSHVSRTATIVFST